jgi:hypothetical protein
MDNLDPKAPAGHPRLAPVAGDGKDSWPYSDVYRGLTPLSEDAAKERAIRRCELRGKTTENVVISIMPSQDRRDYFKVLVRGKRGEDIITHAVLIHRFSQKGDTFERDEHPKARN